MRVVFRCSGSSRQTVVLLLAGLLFLCPSVQSIRYRHYCDLADASVVLELQSDGRSYALPGAAEAVTLGEFSPPAMAPSTTAATGNGATDEDNSKRANSPSTIQARRCPCWNPRIYENSTGPLNSDFYCAADAATHCGVPFRGRYQDLEEPPGCVGIGEQTKFARSIWPMLVISYAFLATFLLCSRPGRNVLGCCISRIIPPWNDWMTDRIILQYPSMANGVILRSLREEQELRRRNEAAEAAAEGGAAQQQSPWRLWGNRVNTEHILELGPDEWALLVRDPATAAVIEALNNRNNATAESSEPIPTALKLRTRIYQSGDYNFLSEDEGQILQQDNDDPEKGIELSGLRSPGADNIDINEEDKLDEEEASSDEQDHHHSCTICYAPILDGERVGALPTCDHIFHVECLKLWLTRRNVCPLCLSEDIAAPQYERQTSTLHVGSVEETENTDNSEGTTGVVEVEESENI